METILYAVRIGAPDYAEEIITTHADRIPEATQWAKENGFDRLRVATIDTTTPPQFGNNLLTL